MTYEIKSDIQLNCYKNRGVIGRRFYDPPIVNKI